MYKNQKQVKTPLLPTITKKVSFFKSPRASILTCLMLITVCTTKNQNITPPKTPNSSITSWKIETSLRLHHLKEKNHQTN